MKLKNFIIHTISYVLVTATLFSSYSYGELQIPQWIKNNAKWWSEDQISDSDFVKGMQYLIQQGIMKMPSTVSQNSTYQKIPLWVKNNAGWWANNAITDNDFLGGIQYLIKINVIKINSESAMTLSSSDFENNGTIPSEYTCDGKDVSPPLTISNVSQNAKSLALVINDIDAPSGSFIHWSMWNIPPQKTQFDAGEKLDLPQGASSSGTVGYVGPCPPSGTHRYFFKLYALDSMLQLYLGSTNADLEKAMNGHVIEQATLIGKYSRN